MYGIPGYRDPEVYVALTFFQKHGKKIALHVAMFTLGFLDVYGVAEIMRTLGL